MLSLIKIWLAFKFNIFLVQLCTKSRYIWIWQAVRPDILRISCVLSPNIHKSSKPQDLTFLRSITY